MKQFMKKITLTFFLFAGISGVSLAQSTGNTQTSTKEVDPKNRVEISKTSPTKEVKSVNKKNIEALPVNREVIIEEKETKQK